MSPPRRAAIISGVRGAGKTTLCLKLADAIGAIGDAAVGVTAAGGIVCPAVFDGDGNKIGFRCVSLGSGESWELGLTKGDKDEPGEKKNATEKYIFSANGIELAIAALRESLAKEGELTVIDEIGPLELRQGGGIAPILTLLETAGNLIVVVRPELIDEVVGLIPYHESRVFKVSENNRESLVAEICRFFTPLRDSM
jgi:nucleoside-triphosphatase THEP1